MATHNLYETLKALDAGRVFVKAGNGFYLARHDATWELPSGEWLIRVRARSRTQRFITSSYNTSDEYYVSDPK